MYLRILLAHFLERRNPQDLSKCKKIWTPCKYVLHDASFHQQGHSKQHHYSEMAFPDPTFTNMQNSLIPRNPE